MKTPKKTSEQDDVILNRMDALLGTGEASEDLISELRQLGIDAEELKGTAFQRIRALATQKYSSRGEDLPARMGEALSQLRPPTPVEEQARRKERANSRVKDMLAAIKNAGSSFSVPARFAPAYRNKETETPESDKELLEDQQKELDGEGER